MVAMVTPPPLPSRVLIPIWKVCVEAVDKSLKDFKSKKGANLSLLSQRLTATWDLLKEFFHADGHGLDTAEMETSMHSTVSHVMLM